MLTLTSTLPATEQSNSPRLPTSSIPGGTQDHCQQQPFSPSLLTMAAELAAGAWAAEEVVSTTAQLGVAAYMVSKPTMPLKAVFTQIANSTSDDTR